MIDHADLAQFSGSEQYYRHNFMRSFLYTEGVKYVAGRTAVNTVLLASSTPLHPTRWTRITKNAMLREIQFWTLTVKDKKGVLVCRTDSGKPPAITQEIEYTDFDFPEIKVYVVHNGNGFTAMLPREY